MPDTSAPSSTFWTVHCDGSAVPNPGRMAYGAVVLAPDGQRSTLSQPTTDIGCNNEAELRALMAALLAVRSAGGRDVLLHSDNSIVVAQLGGTGPPPPPIARLAGLVDQARALIASFDRVRLQWVPRHRNAEADALARAAQGLPPKPPVKARRRNG
ncbi:reverse transcriptase-like protein [Xylophilus sp. Kf1]|nr:reverse transcriptase-like protein [Xylophilus sp. Kf1]